MKIPSYRRWPKPPVSNFGSYVVSHFEERRCIEVEQKKGKEIYRGGTEMSCPLSKLPDCIIIPAPYIHTILLVCRY